MAQIILDSNNNLIQGDFDNATVNNRTKFKTTTTNATTNVYAVPNGSATSAGFTVTNAADPTNASKLTIATNGSTDTQIISGINGSGTYLPMSFYVNNALAFQYGTAGELKIGSGASAGTSGQVLTSGGAGAAPTWASISTSANPQYALYTSGTSTWTCPAGVTKIKVTVIGGGGGGAFWSSISSYGGGTGGAGFNYYTVTPGTGYTVTVGAGGNGGSGSGSNGGTSSFSSLISATGGAGTVTYQVPGADGTCANGLLSTGAMAGNGYGFLGSVTSTYASNTAQTWTNSLGYTPGAKGLRYNACQGSGGVGGAVYIEYVG